MVISTNRHTIAIRNDGSLWSCGYNSIGELGLGPIISMVDTFTQVGTDINWRTVSPASGFTTAIKDNNTLWAWGENSYGQVGDGTTLFVATPKQIGVDANWATIAAGFYHSLAIWGEGAFGKLGNGATSNNLIPVKIGDGNNWHSVSASPFILLH